MNLERVPRLLQVLPESETPAESPMLMDDEVGPVLFRTTTTFYYYYYHYCARYLRAPFRVLRPILTFRYLSIKIRFSFSHHYRHRAPLRRCVSLLYLSISALLNFNEIMNWPIGSQIDADASYVRWCYLTCYYYYYYYHHYRHLLSLLLSSCHYYYYYYLDYRTVMFTLVSLSLSLLWKLIFLRVTALLRAFCKGVTRLNCR